MPDNAVLALLQHVTALPALAHLDLSTAHRIDGMPEHAAQWGPYIAQSCALTRLELSQAALVPEAVSSIAGHLALLPKLQQLDLAGVLQGDKLALALASHIPAMSQLTSCNVHGARLSAVGAQALLQSMAYQPERVLCIWISVSNEHAALHWPRAWLL
jgi:hypothetical protein